MNKLIYLSACALMLGAVSCSHSEKTATADSTADSAQTDTVVAIDSASIRPTEEVAEDVNPEEVLTLTVEKKNLKYAPESEAKSGSWTVKVTNNGKTEVKGADYVVAYDEIVEETVNGEFANVTKKRTAEGQDVAPGESVMIQLKAKAGCQDFKNPKIANTKK